MQANPNTHLSPKNGCVPYSNIWLLCTVSVRFQPVGSAPILKQRVFKISASSKFSVVLNFLRKKVGLKEGDGLFCYVNSVFAPGLDEGVGNLYRVSLRLSFLPNQELFSSFARAQRSACLLCTSVVMFREVCCATFNKTVNRLGCPEEQEEIMLIRVLVCEN